MSEEGRILRLENAFSTLAELAAEQQRQTGDQQRRTARLEESFLMLTEMLSRHEDSFDGLRAAQAETELKIAALVDAHLRIEEAHGKGMGELRAALGKGMGELRAALAELAGSVKHLAESQAHADQRLDGLIDIVRELRGGRA